MFSTGQNFSGGYGTVQDDHWSKFSKEVSRLKVSDDPAYGSWDGPPKIIRFLSVLIRMVKEINGVAKVEHEFVINAVGKRYVRMLTYHTKVGGINTIIDVDFVNKSTDQALPSKIRNNVFDAINKKQMELDKKKPQPVVVEKVEKPVVIKLDEPVVEVKHEVAVEPPKPKEEPKVKPKRVLTDKMRAVLKKMAEVSKMNRAARKAKESSSGEVVNLNIDPTA